MVQISETLFLNGGATFSNAGLSFSLDQNTLKFTFEISDWSLSSQGIKLVSSFFLLISIFPLRKSSGV